MFALFFNAATVFLEHARVPGRLKQLWCHVPGSWLQSTSGSSLFLVLRLAFGNFPTFTTSSSYLFSSLKMRDYFDVDF